MKKFTPILALLSFVPPLLAQRDETYFQGQQGQLNIHRDLWRRTGPADYKYYYTKICNTCTADSYPWSTIVTSGQPPAARGLDTKGYYKQGLTTDNIFDCIQRALNPVSSGGAQGIKVEYDETYGYVTHALILWDNASQQLSQNQETITQTQFEVRAGSPEYEYKTNRDAWDNQRIWTYVYSYTKYGYNPENIVYPLTVQVTNRMVTRTTDGNGNVVNWYTPPTLDGFFDIINRAITSNAPYIDVYYSKRGFPEGDMKLYTSYEGLLHYNIGGFTY